MHLMHWKRIPGGPKPTRKRLLLRDTTEREVQKKMKNGGLGDEKNEK